MPNCAVSSCTNHNKKTRGTNIRYHTFPMVPHICEQWIRACNRNTTINLKHATICSIHFRPEDYSRDLKAEYLTIPYKKTLRPFAVPTLFLNGAEGAAGRNLPRSRPPRMTFSEGAQNNAKMQAEKRININVSKKSENDYTIPEPLVELIEIKDECIEINSDDEYGEDSFDPCYKNFIRDEEENSNNVLSSDACDRNSDDSNPLEEDDECSAFAKFVTLRLRKISRTKRTEIMDRISSVLCQAEMDAPECDIYYSSL